MSDSFYSDLSVHESFTDVANSAVYGDVPVDWHIAVADVRGSTEAIQAGRYREVNTVGASTITAVLNAARNAGRSSDLPFMFGGDGAVVLVPPGIVAEVRAALAGTIYVADRAFGLELRAGTVPVQTVLEAGKKVRVARFVVSPHYHQAMFSGGGVAHAEALVKDHDTSRPFAIHRKPEASDVDLSGLECRWEDVPSRHGEAVTLIAKALGSPESAATEYSNLIVTIDRIYGEGIVPLRSDLLRLSTSHKVLGHESSVRAESLFGRRLYTAKSRAENALVRILTRMNMRTRGVNWNEYKLQLVESSDYRKFDDTLRMILSGEPAKRNQLTDYLDERDAVGALTYGMHLSDRVLLTCVVFERMGRQVHFVDGADGGYALAAKALKEKVASS